MAKSRVLTLSVVVSLLADETATMSSANQIGPELSGSVMRMFSPRLVGWQDATKSMSASQPT